MKILLSRDVAVSRWLRFPADFFLRLEDERIYAVVRIGFAIAVLLNLLAFWPDRAIFLTDSGFVFPDIAQREAQLAYISIFRFIGSGEMAVTAAMLVTALALVCLLAGIAARLAAVWVMLWHISYLATSPLSLVGWDYVLRAFSFLVLISPLGKCWSVPALLRGLRDPGRGRCVAAWVPCYGLMLLRLQVVAIYWQAVLARLFHPDSYWRNGEYMSYVMLSHYARWPGLWVLEQQELLALATYGTLLAELALPVLLWVKKTRWWGALLGLALHVGISVFTPGIWLFGLSMVTTYLAYLRTEDLEAFDRWMSHWRSPKPAPAPSSSS